MKQLRQTIYEKIENKKDKEHSSTVICEKLVGLDVFKTARTVFCYISLRNEVQTSLIIEQALMQQKIVGVPRTEKMLKFVAIGNDTIYRKGDFGVLEPTNNEEIKNCDLIIVPMVAFDMNCNRMGHGKGYYDRYLANKNCVKIGIAFAEQEAKFDVFPHDIAMDMVITETKIYFKNQ